MLSAALDAAPERRQPAEALLQSWESQPSYPSTLHAIISDVSIDINIRWLASVCLKNCVIRWWHKRITSGAEVSVRVSFKHIKVNVKVTFFTGIIIDNCPTNIHLSPKLVHVTGCRENSFAASPNF